MSILWICIRKIGVFENALSWQENSAPPLFLLFFQIKKVRVIARPVHTKFSSPRLMMIKVWSLLIPQVQAVSYTRQRCGLHTFLPPNRLNYFMSARPLSFTRRARCSSQFREKWTGSAQLRRWRVLRTRIRARTYPALRLATYSWFRRLCSRISSSSCCSRFSHSYCFCREVCCSNLEQKEEE